MSICTLNCYSAVNNHISCSLCWLCHISHHRWLPGHIHSDSSALPHSGSGIGRFGTSWV